MTTLTEKEIVKIWQHQLLERKGLATEDGEPLRIIYPGRLNDERGADFQQAIVVNGGRLLRGDVEIHIRSSGWQEHGHDRDVVYNSVILHVVMWRDNNAATRLQNGREVPVLALGKYIAVSVGHGAESASASGGLNLACFRVVERLNRENVAQLLDLAGDERFLIKGAWFQKDLARREAGQSIYQGIMGALGYSRNKLPFLELSRRLPLRLLESMIQCKIPEAGGLLKMQALLLGTSGLLFSQPRDVCPGNRLGGAWTDELVRLWLSFQHPRAMSPDSWHLLRVRPNNSPVLRLVAMSYLLLRYRESGLLEGLVRLVSEAPSGRGGQKSLEAGLVVSIDESPVSFSTSGTVGRANRLTLLGKGRAADIIVNVILPFTFAWRQSTSQPELGEKALDIYRLYPRLAINSAEKHVTEQLGLDNGLVNSARRQQGLLHIYQRLCTAGRCNRCPLSHPQPGHHI